jgi:hypothetical protein
MQSYQAEGYGRMSLLLFLAHFIRYYDIQPDDLRVTSYCDNSSLLTTEEAFHTRDMDSSSWYLKPDHDVIMTLSEIRTNTPFKLASQRDFDDLTRPEQLNVLADHRATAALKELCAAGQPTDFYPLPACRAISVMPPGISPVAKSARSEPNFPSTYLQKRNNRTDQVYDSISWSAYRSATGLLTDNVRTFVTKLSHGWLPVGVRESRCSAATDTCPHCNEIEFVPHLYRCQSQATCRINLSPTFMCTLKTHTPLQIYPA